MNFEKGVVCRKIHNYTTVTDEFFTEYGGHHNRDKVHRKPYSFKGGTTQTGHLIGVEYLFILLFQVMYQMATMFFICESILKRRTKNAQRHRTTFLSR
jgi:hypothetical protein